MSVRLSVRLSVTLIRWWIVITRVGFVRKFSLALLLYADPNITDLLQRKHPQILAGIRVGVSRRISETVQDRVQVAIDHLYESVHALSFRTKVDNLA